MRENVTAQDAVPFTAAVAAIASGVRNTAQTGKGSRSVLTYIHLILNSELDWHIDGARIREAPAA